MKKSSFHSEYMTREKTCVDTQSLIEGRHLTFVGNKVVSVPGGIQSIPAAKALFVEIYPCQIGLINFQYSNYKTSLKLSLSLCLSCYPTVNHSSTVSLCLSVFFSQILNSHSLFFSTLF